MVGLMISCRSCRRQNQFKSSNDIMIVIVLLIASSRYYFIPVFCRGAHSSPVWLMASSRHCSVQTLLGKVLWKKNFSGEAD